MKSRLIFLSLIILCSGVSLVYGQKPLRKPVRLAETRVLSVSGSVNGHDYVDLGLSVKWATCNVGANFPEDYGDYYAWGEVYSKSDYSRTNCQTYSRSLDNISGDSAYDVARLHWAKGWRLPTKKEIEELKTKCKTYWTTYKGVNGYLVERKGKCLFLPAAGFRFSWSLDYEGYHGRYWSATPNEDNEYYAYYFGFGTGYFNSNWYSRYFGFSVRPVLD